MGGVKGGAESEEAGRRRMLDDIDLEVCDTRGLIGLERLSERVLAAMAGVPRHLFVPPSLESRAYDNGPLPIGHGQTISQPYIVALMTELLRLLPKAVVLEVGTGSGYQAAVLARLVRQVYSVEIVPALAAEAAARLRRLGVDNVVVCQGDGYFGWPEHAPYDAVIVTAATPRIPLALVQQLRPGGRLVLPVGGVYEAQELRVVEKGADGTVIERGVLPVAFVPLTRESL